MKDFGAIDKIEGNIVVIEISSTEKIVNIFKNKISFEVNEGDILDIDVIYDEYGNIKDIKVLSKNEHEKERRNQIIKEKLKKLTSM